MPAERPEEKKPTASDVLLANQLYYAVQAKDYDSKNHVANPSILRYYNRLFDRYVFDGASTDAAHWRVCDVGCGTGFLESVLSDRVGSIVAVDATLAMLQSSRQKFPKKKIVWIMGDGRALPLMDGQFDLVCSNAMLHHIFGYEDVLSKMIALLKPGGRLFLGYEPNAIPYRLFWPLLMLAAKIVPEHKDRERIQRESGQDKHPSLRGVDIHELAEFQIFHGRGIDPLRLRSFVEARGITNTRLHFSSIYQAALLKDSGVPWPVEFFPDWVYRLSSRLSLSFSVTGIKAA